MSKARKPNMVDGCLCRDSNKYGGTNLIAFFFGGTDPAKAFPIEGVWQNPGKCRSKEWTLAEWEEDYDLVPPRPGRKFEVSLEL